MMPPFGTESAVLLHTKGPDYTIIEAAFTVRAHSLLLAMYVVTPGIGCHKSGEVQLVL